MISAETKTPLILSEEFRAYLCNIEQQKLFENGLRSNFQPTNIIRNPFIYYKIYYNPFWQNSTSGKTTDVTVLGTCIIDCMR